MSINEYLKLFLKQAHVLDFILLLVGFYLLITNVIGFFNSEVGLFNILWGLLGAVIIGEVFGRLRKKAILENLQSPEVISEVKEDVEVLSQKSKNFWNYFPLILFIINVVSLILIWNSMGGYEFFFIIILVILMISAIPVVIFPLLGKFKVFSNILAFVFLMPAICGLIFVYVFLPLVNR